MKYNILKEGQSIEVVTGFNTYTIPNFWTNEPETTKSDVLKTKIFTDGVIAEESSPVVEEVNDFYVQKKYCLPNNACSVSNISVKDVTLKDASYAVLFLIAEEFFRLNHGGAYENVLENVSVYIKNPKDKETWRKIKETIKYNPLSYKLDNSPIGVKLGTMFYTSSFDDMYYEKHSDNVYTLKRIK